MTYYFFSNFLFLLIETMNIQNIIICFENKDNLSEFNEHEFINFKADLQFSATTKS